MTRLATSTSTPVADFSHNHWNKSMLVLVVVVLTLLVLSLAAYHSPINFLGENKKLTDAIASNTLANMGKNWEWQVMWVEITTHNKVKNNMESGIKHFVKGKVHLRATSPDGSGNFVVYFKALAKENGFGDVWVSDFNHYLAVDNPNDPENFSMEKTIRE